MKVKVLQVFVDKHNHITRYEPGTVHEFDDERAMDLVERGLAEEEAPLIPLKGETEEAEEVAEAEVAPEVVAEVKEVAEVEAEAEVAPEVVAEAEVAPEVKTPKKAKK